MPWDQFKCRGTNCKACRQLDRFRIPATKISLVFQGTWTWLCSRFKLLSRIPFWSLRCEEFLCCQNGLRSQACKSAFKSFDPLCAKLQRGKIWLIFHARMNYDAQVGISQTLHAIDTVENACYSISHSLPSHVWAFSRKKGTDGQPLINFYSRFSVSSVCNFNVGLREWGSAP